jgi:hypothetical protein
VVDLATNLVIYGSIGFGVVVTIIAALRSAILVAAERAVRD